MTQTPDATDKSVADAEDKLARLGVEIEVMQAVLTRLMQDVARAESRLDRSQAARLVEVNEQLVVAAMTAQADAETAAQALRDAALDPALDALTQLPSRTTLLDRFAQAVANAKRHGTRFALLFLDLDNFKQINDTHGHVFGDKVLRLAADRMLSVVREVDTVSRHGGDEFLVLLAELNQPGDAQTVAEKLIAAIGAPAELDGHVVSVTGSVGIAMYPDDGQDVDTLVARADAAMYQTKRQRCGGVAFHGKAPVEAPGLRAQPDSPAHQTVRTSASEVAEAERRLADLREANEKLVLAALTRAGAAGGRRAGAAAADGLAGRGGRGAAQSDGAHPHRQRDAGVPANRRPAAAAHAAHRRAADDAHVAPGRQPGRCRKRGHQRTGTRPPFGRHGPGHRPGRRCKPTDDGRTRAAVRLAPAARRHRSAG